MYVYGLFPLLFMLIQLEVRSCIIFSLSLVSPWNGKANKNVSEWNLQQSPGRQAFVWRVSF